MFLRNNRTNLTWVPCRCIMLKDLSHDDKPFKLLAVSGLVSGPALLLGGLSAQLTERLTSSALRATSPMKRGFSAPRYYNRDSLIMPEAGSPRASPYNRSQAINLSRPAALCVGAVL